MPRESLPVDADEKALLTDFETSIYAQIHARGDDNHIVDRYKRQSGEPISADFDYRYDPHTGNVEFGDSFLTHRLDLEEFQVIYAFRPRTVFVVGEAERFVLGMSKADEEPAEENPPLPANAELYVHEFGESGAGNISRTVFSESEDRGIVKTRTTMFDALQGLGVPDFHRPLKARERVTLKEVIESPEEHVIALRGLVTLTKSEQRAARKTQEEYYEREKELRKQLEQIARARRMPAPDMLID